MQMRTKLMIGSTLLLALPLMAIASQDEAKPPMMMQKMIDVADANHDGMIDKAEHRALADKRFEEADTNRDGKLSAEEMKRAHHEQREERHEMRMQWRSDKMQDHRQMRFDNEDANDDGKITFEEFTAAHKEHFEMLDANHDSLIDKDEMARPVTKIMVFKNDDPAKGQVIEQHIEKRIEMRLDKLDDNNDGKLSVAEFNTHQKARFEAMDANHDGQLDMSEMPQPMMGHGSMGGMGPHHRMKMDDDDLQVECKVIEESAAVESK